MSTATAPGTTLPLARELASAEAALHQGRRRARLVTAAVWACRALVVVVPLLIWQELSDRGYLAPFIYSSPTAVAERLGEWLTDGTIAENAWFTISNAVAGYVLGLALAAVCASVFVAMPRVGAAFMPFVAMGNALPRIALAPLLVAWFGFGVASNIALVVVVVFFVNFFNIHGGLVDVDETYETWARSLGASRGQLRITVKLPSIIRWVLSGMRTSIGLALSAAIVSEFVGGAKGIGYLVSSSSNVFQSAGVYAGMAVTIVFAGLVDTALRYCERRWAHWVGQG